MACNNRITLLSELADLVNQIGDGGETCAPAPTPCCMPCNFPFAQVTMTYPPPCLAPTAPQPVRPLQLPSPKITPPTMSLAEREQSRYDNFYNNYNIDWHKESPRYKRSNDCSIDKQRGQTLDGKSPCCDVNYNDDCETQECPTGFKPCSMRLTAPNDCHPYGIWCAEIQPCPPKPKQNDICQPGDCFKCK